MNFFYSILQRIIELIHRLFKSRGAILLFHEIDDDISNCIDAPKCWIKKSSFEMMIEEVTKNYKIVNIEELLSSKNKNYLVLTFDDVYENFYTNAYPILKEKKIPFTIFVTTNRLDKKHYLSRKQLLDLAVDELCTIGSHSVSHGFFSKMSNNQVRNELERSKNFLTELVSQEIIYFSYPYGSFYASPNKYANLLKETNYKYAFSTLKTPLSFLSKKYYLPRININEENYIKTVRRLNR